MANLAQTVHKEIRKISTDEQFLLEDNPIGMNVPITQLWKTAPHAQPKDLHKNYKITNRK